MLYIRVSDKVKIDSSYISSEQAKEVCELLNRHGYYPTRFGKDLYNKTSIEFYNKDDVVQDNNVPVHKYFKMNSRELFVFLEVLQKLDAAERKMSRYVDFVSSTR